ncbi:SpoIID/LytB domain protein [Georgenia satyanarayanai]|uniref:SpoIID/LytB domain protein n=1 Tax=Georgenia satyanarayanai TaxID=860221 RepID=A0A2Y9C039_9MICO|nr:SpoIID/LytB domain-containing protein [Georgenia satyanarayanai]PYF97898.1 SpoIID/LytB domain protein [Georgenia satyanarayanai]SSA45472.1 SpoIID/LytB domain protein [Georgenia satyanarayanai]
MRSVRHLLSSALAAALTLGVVVGLPTAASADETYPRPGSGSWEIQGRGWGHGIGMSQWGAQGAALQGLTHRQILGFYYPGTAVGSVRNNPLDVRLMAHQNTDSVRLWAPQGANRLQVAGAGNTTRSYAGGYVTVDRADDNRFWVRHSGGAVHAFTATELTVTARNADNNNVGAVVGSSSTRGTWYRGTIQLVRENSTLFDVRNHVALEQYLRGVVPREVPASWHTQALRAQSVAARSYVLAEIAGNSAGLTCDTTQCQVYGGRATVDRDGDVLTAHDHPRTDAAVADTAGEVRTYGGSVAFTQFSSTNGGWTKASTRPYLVAKPDPYTGTAPGDTRTTWTDRLSVGTVEAYCPSNGRLRNLVITERDGNGAFGGRITEARVECSTGNRTLTNLRFDLFSEWWRVTPPPTGFFLSNTLGAEAEIVFQYGRDDDEVLIGDWDGNRTDTITMRRGKIFHVSNSLRAGGADYSFPYGRANDVILIGDWNGDGRDSIAVRRGREYHIRNDNRPGDAQRVITYGHADDDVLVGDWNGDGRDTLAVRRGSVYHVKNSLTGGDADSVISYGRADDDVIVGDWNGNGRDTFGVRRGNVYHLKNSISGGDADRVVAFGRATDEVLVGDWNGDRRDTLGLRRLG